MPAASLITKQSPAPGQVKPGSIDSAQNGSLPLPLEMMVNRAWPSAMNSANLRYPKCQQLQAGVVTFLVSISLRSDPLPVPPQLRHSHAAGMSGRLPFNACLANAFNCALVALVALIVLAMSPVSCAKIRLVSLAGWLCLRPVPRKHNVITMTIQAPIRAWLLYEFKKVPQNAVKLLGIGDRWTHGATIDGTTAVIL